MEDKVKITSLELENVKRVKAVRIEPTENGLTVIGGKNNNGKTSVLDAIVWTLGGDKNRPSQPKREGSMIDPHMKIVLNNGFIVERAGKNSALKVTDPSGNKAGQKLLDTFISQFALNIPKFMEANDKEKANTLLQIIGVGDQLTHLDQEESKLYSRRTEIGRIADQKKKYADELPEWDSVPGEIISASDLIEQQQEILARNGQRQQWIREYDRILEDIRKAEDRIEEYKKMIHDQEVQLKDLYAKKTTAQKSPKELEMESTTELEANIQQIDVINAKIRQNIDKKRAVEEADDYKGQYDDLTVKINEVRDARMKLLEGAEMPLAGLSIDHGLLIYKGQQWDNMSGSDQLKVAASIVRKLNPQCGFVLMDKLEQMDLDTLKDFGSWLEKENLQVIATRVSTGDECTIYIEDGYSIDKNGQKTAAVKEEKAPAQKWTWNGGK